MTLSLPTSLATSLAKSRRTTLLASAFLALGAPAALADSGGGYIQNASPSPVVVVSNGSSYTQIDGPANLSLMARLNYSTGTAGRVKSWEAWPIITTGYGIHQEVQNTRFWGGASKSYPIGNRPKTLGLSIGLTLPMSMVEPVAVGMCNMLASNLRSQGQSNAQIFGTDRKVKLLADLGYTVDASGAGANQQVFEHALPREIAVTCARTQGPRAPLIGTVKAPGAGATGSILPRR